MAFHPPNTTPSPNTFVIVHGLSTEPSATVYQFADGSVAYFALDAPAWREADEIAARALLAIKRLTTVFST